MQADGIERQLSLLTEAVEESGGVVFETVGDDVYAAFEDACSAVEAATAAQLALLRYRLGRLREWFAMTA